MDSPQSNPDALRPDAKRPDARFGTDSAWDRAPARGCPTESGRPGGPTPSMGCERAVHAPEVAGSQRVDGVVSVPGQTPAPLPGDETAPMAGQTPVPPPIGEATPAAGMGVESPQRSSGSSRVLHFAKWTIAMIGVFALHLLLQIVSSAVGGIAIVAVDFGINGAGPAVDDMLFDNGIQVVMVVSQLIAVAIFWPWWRRIRPGSFGERREAAAPARVSVVKTVAVLLLIGFAAQFFVSGILGMVEVYFPEEMAEYAELMEDSAVGVFAALEVVSTVVLAPLNEEIVCRGIMLEYAMRAVSPGWNPRDRARRRAVSARAFWVANMLQALAFGVLHMNIIQGSYAFALGVLQGWVFWRTGKLRYAMLLHLALNASSYLVAPLTSMLSMLRTSYVFSAFSILLVGGIIIFGFMWDVSDALPEVERPLEER